MDRNDPCWCGSGKKWKKCHFPAPPKENLSTKRQQYLKQYGIRLKTAEEIDGIRKSCKLSARILDDLCKMAQKGVTTEQLNQFAHQEMLKAGAIPATLGYGDPPFQKSICTSLNDVICHGIPDNTRLKEGDILNIDITTILNGYYGDCSRMVTIGEVSEEKRNVVDVSYQCMINAIHLCKPGVMLYEIGDAISDHAEENGCSVVDYFVGHGVGVDFHEPPQVPHHRNRLKIPLDEGMTFTIEPMINAGRKEAVIDPFDHWTARTVDGKPSAQWEHTILITADGVEILTLP